MYENSFVSICDVERADPRVFGPLTLEEQFPLNQKIDTYTTTLHKLMVTGAIDSEYNVLIYDPDGSIAKIVSDLLEKISDLCDMKTNYVKYCKEMYYPKSPLTRLPGKYSSPRPMSFPPKRTRLTVEPLQVDSHPCDEISLMEEIRGFDARTLRPTSEVLRMCELNLQTRMLMDVYDRFGEQIAEGFYQGCFEALPVRESVDDSDEEKPPAVGETPTNRPSHERSSVVDAMVKRFDAVAESVFDFFSHTPNRRRITVDETFRPDNPSRYKFTNR